MGEELVDPENRRNIAQSDNVVAHNARPNQWPLIGGALIALFLIVRDSSTAGLSALEVECLTGLALLCAAPVFQWYRQGMMWIPLGEAYVLMHIPYYVLPCFAKRGDWFAYSASLRVDAILAVGVFLSAFLVTYVSLLKRSRLSVTRIKVLYREAPIETMWILFSIWLVLSLLLQFHALDDVGLSLNVAHATITATGCVSVVFLFYQLGKGHCSDGQRVYLMGGFIFGLALNFANGFLNGTAQVLGAALLAFALGRKKVPLKALALSMALLSLLQLGKQDYRDAYWGKGLNYSEQRVPLVEGYKTWFSAAWQKVLHANEPGADNRGILNRTSLIQMLARVMYATPATQHFVYGETYLMFPALAVPRMFWPDKPRGSFATETLCIYYGIQTEKSAETTGVSIGQPAEAWANFGWFGLVAEGACFGVLFGVPAALTRTLVPNQIGWLLATIFLVYSLNLEHCIPEVCASLVTALFMGIVVLVAISRAAEVVAERFERKRRMAGTFSGSGAPWEGPDV